MAAIFFTIILSKKQILGWIGIGGSLCVMLGTILLAVLGKNYRTNQCNLLIVGVLFSAISIYSTTSFSSWYAVLFFLIYYLAGGIIFPIRKSLLHDNIHNAERATIASINSLFSSIGGSIGLIFYSFMADIFSISTVMKLSAILLLWTTLPILFSLKKITAHNTSNVIHGGA